MKHYTAQTKPKAKGSLPSQYETAPSSASTPKLPSTPSASDLVKYVRFVLHSGHALEFQADTVEEMSETWANKACHAVVGVQACGTRAAIPIENVAYLEEVAE